MSEAALSTREVTATLRRVALPFFLVVVFATTALTLGAPDQVVLPLVLVIGIAAPSVNRHFENGKRLERSPSTQANSTARLAEQIDALIIKHGDSRDASVETSVESLRRLRGHIEDLEREEEIRGRLSGFPIRLLMKVSRAAIAISFFVQHLLGRF